METKCFIAQPIYGAVDAQHHLCTLKLIEAVSRGALAGAMLPRLGDSAVCRARNWLTRKFLESDCTHILFIDSDLVFSLEQAQRIMAHQELVVGGLYQKKQEGQPELVINTYPDPKPVTDSGLMEVRYIGAGFLRIARSVFERMIAAWEEELWYNPDYEPAATEYDFWHMGVYKYPDGKRRWLSEDWWFCQKCLDLGIRVWADMHILMRHSGTALYPLSYQEQSLYGSSLVVVQRAGAEATIAPARL